MSYLFVVFTYAAKRARAVGCSFSWRVVGNAVSASWTALGRHSDMNSVIIGQIELAWAQGVSRRNDARGKGLKVIRLIMGDHVGWVEEEVWGELTP